MSRDQRSDDHNQRLLLIDYQHVIAPSRTELASFLRRVQPVPRAPHLSVGLLLHLTASDWTLITAQPLGITKVRSLNDLTPLQYCWTMDDQLHDCCQILGVNGLSWEQIKSYLPCRSTYHIFFQMNDEQLDSYLPSFITAGFEEPHILKRTKDNYTFAYYGLRLTKFIDRSPDPNAVRVAIIDALKQFINEPDEPANSACRVNIRLTPPTIEKLQQLRHGDSHDHEVGGALILEPGYEDRSSIIYPLSLDEQGVSNGHQEKVSIPRSRYNFHSHPATAYIRHSLKFAWPSGQDYVAFLGAVFKFGTVLHLVATAEGIYIISLAESWIGRLEPTAELEKFVFHTYDISHQEPLSPDEYCRVANAIEWSDDSQSAPLFVTQFRTWTHAGKTISVFYARDGLTCRASDTVKSMNE